MHFKPVLVPLPIEQVHHLRTGGNTNTAKGTTDPNVECSHQSDRFFVISQMIKVQFQNLGHHSIISIMALELNHQPELKNNPQQPKSHQSRLNITTIEVILVTDKDGQ